MSDQAPLQGPVLVLLRTATLIYMPKLLEIVLSVASARRSQDPREIDLMLGTRNRRKEIVRIDVDWLLGETTKNPPRDFSWFKRTIVCLACVSMVVWSWPYASKAWLKWEWQQQLAQLTGKQSEDVLPIMLALQELSPAGNDASPIPSPIELPLIATPPSIVKSIAEPAIETAQIARVSPILPATRMRINDSGDANPLDPPSMRQLQNMAPIVESPPIDTVTIPTSMRTPKDQAATTVVPQLPNLSLTIPRTVTKSIVVLAPSVSPEPVEELTPSGPNVTLDTPESSVIRGIEKLPLEKLLPLLTSSQSRIVQQTFNELVRRGMRPKQLEIAVALAQGDVEQRLKAMDAIARDPKFEDSIKWLVWMADSADLDVRRRADSADLDVRRRAVVLLGSMTNPEAMRKLRLLLSREPDSVIADQINQVLLASGTASKSVR